jgi:hypothetical protein
MPTPQLTKALAQPREFYTPDERLEAPAAGDQGVAIEYSIAASLKRIADALDKITGEVDTMRRVLGRRERKGL